MKASIALADDPSEYLRPAARPLTLPASLAARRGARLGDVKLPLLIVNIPPEEVASWPA